jgi:hypothetical protein
MSDARVLADELDVRLPDVLGNSLKRPIDVV